MLQIQPAKPGLLFGSFLYRSDLHDSQKLHALWADTWGESFFLVPEFNPLAQYYQKEMGDPLERFFVVSSTPYSRDHLLTSKLRALEWENQFAEADKRTVNIDTGFITLENFLLATTKNYSHRVFIGHGLFADLTYQFASGAFSTFPWTYPDYLDPKKIEFITWCRSYLSNLLTPC